jgi:uncharacterized coiled-coil protein SlyX
MTKERPRLSTAVENRLARLEHESAHCYTALEEMSDKFKGLAREIDQAEQSVPELIEGAEDSMVHHLERLSQALVPAPDPPAPASQTEYSIHRPRKR